LDALRKVSTVPLHRALVFAALALLPVTTRAAELGDAVFSAWWSIPFVGMLLSIAVLPLIAPRVWHHHYGKIAAGWIAAFLLPFAWTFGLDTAVRSFVHTLLAEYIPFIILLIALYTSAGGIYVRGNLRGRPSLNTALLAVGAVLASLMGTTGASMLLVRPLIRANDNRRHVAHVMVFFIFIVANAGGSLTPLGDPPLFLGFLQGVSFFWTLQHLFPETLFLVGTLLAIFFAIDTYWYRREGVEPVDPTPDSPRVGIDGAINVLPLLAIVGLVLLSGSWKSGHGFEVFGTRIMLEQVVRDLGLVVVTFVSLAITPRGVRAANAFDWGPMAEVGKLFIAIFLTMIPVLAMLRAGIDGPLAGIARAVTGPDGEPVPAAYFWLSGLLSSVLDNAPTYLVFFNLAGGDPQVLMTTFAATLSAISAGSVFMGANTYIGNAPNLMVKAIAESRGVKMPSFIGYMAWSCLILLPLFGLMTAIWFR
jgi:Na+/H+ antiporter NhaD/arsenite permease-like protein